MRYCDDGRLEIDNNAAERALRQLRPYAPFGVREGMWTATFAALASHSVTDTSCSTNTWQEKATQSLSLYPSYEGQRPLVTLARVFMTRRDSDQIRNAIS